jgi:SAM-dependent methyltransferase
MHQGSYDKMAAFCRDYLGSMRSKPLRIVDLGSCDYNGSYRPLFNQSPWNYVGADLQPGENVDVVLRDPYHWREFESESVDVVVSGQTFEHTEFFWETILEIARILKPQGLCCIIAPATGPEHRFPLDCWRIYTDGFRALARYAGLEVLYSRTQWDEPPQYDSESNKWHESILIARKPAETLRRRWWRRCYPRLSRWIRPLPRKVESLIQVFYSADGTHREETSIVAGVDQGDWESVLITLPSGAAAAPLRIDLMRTFDLVDISELRVMTPIREYFRATPSRNFDQIAVAGDAQRLPHPDFFRVHVTGVDPQLFLPVLNITPGEHPLQIQLRLRVHLRAPKNSTAE